MYRLPALLVVMFVAAPVAADGPAWSYLETQALVGGELEPDFGPDADADGLDINASLGLGDNIFFQAGFEAADVELGAADAAYDRLAIGPGVTVDLPVGNTVIAPWARLDLRRDSVAGLTFDGYGAAVGLRWLLADRLELAVTGEAGRVGGLAGPGTGEAPLEDRSIEVAARLALTPEWMLTAGYRAGEIEDEDAVLTAGGSDIEYRRWLLGVRWNYGTDPRGLIARGGDDAQPADADPFDFVEFVYLFGDEVETRQGGTQTRADIDRGLRVRGSAALGELAFVEAGVDTLHVDTAGQAEDAAGDWYSVGPGLRGAFALGAGELDLFGRASYERVTLGAIFDGPGATLGARYRVAGFEIAPAVKAFATDGNGADFDGQSWSLDLLYRLSPAVALLLHSRYTDAEIEGAGATTEVEQTVFGAGLRFGFGH
ncbi:hypothetical protein [Spectribacter hydrogenoxidans]|uniref:Porin n=1 Tax=Spectribacter hydrogenoxidans TaxID=3075608 RepID=A0ABU3C315_9GAMM|nr:hypothetical protein [Salinisphaera sp. W335]MDT0635734.1 hypothetical protein [Salinisphaera sp. W335]